MFYENNLFWIIIFILEIVILSLLAKKFHSYLFYFTGFATKKSAFSAKIAGIIMFIGTLVHELSHVLMASFLFVRVKSLNIKSEIVEDKHLRFGSAEVEQVDPFRNALVGIAPLIFGVIVVYFLAFEISLTNLTWFDLFKLFLISQISNSMFLSSSDTKYFKYVILLILSLGLIFWILNFYYSIVNINFYSKIIFSFILGNDYVSFLKNLVLVFLFVISFNFFINSILKILSKYKIY
jgi:hypothetical protein